ncbi:hypothetical protein ILUMI_25112 [Ignelater luminosus]|uniref:Uncharacterized protein n=1 Tax=Ignelater luminosus TaxID=2038154 RepID=A0A8K0C5Y7_IGNLU|nr:hypothetical protein ILUMI_25112 [Ignelater luminosus]
MSNRPYEIPETTPEVALDSSSSDVIGLQTPAKVVGPSHGDDKVPPEQIRFFLKTSPRKGLKREGRTGKCRYATNIPETEKLEMAKRKPVNMPLVFSRTVGLDDEEEEEKQGNDYVGVASPHDENRINCFIREKDFPDKGWVLVQFNGEKCYISRAFDGGWTSLLSSFFQIWI